MNDIIRSLSEENASLDDVQRLALDCHHRVTIAQHMVVDGLVQLAENLKTIRDQKLYSALGYEDFGVYTETEHGIGSRQAYNYIRAYETLGKDFLNSNSKIGITKLLLLSGLDRDERDEVMAEHTTDELADMSTAEVKELTEQVKKLREQISMFERDKAEASEREHKAVDEACARVRKEVAGESSAELAKLNTVIKELKADKKTAEESRKAAEIARDEFAKKYDSVKNAESELEELKARVKQAEDAKAETEKQIRLSSDPEYTRFKYMFEAWQQSTQAMTEQMSKLSEEQKTKVLPAVKQVLGVCGL